MNERLEIQSISFDLSNEEAAKYGGWEGLRRELDELGIDGVEGKWNGRDIPEEFPRDMLTGYYMTTFHDWLDFYRGNEKELMRKFGSWETVEKVYGSRNPDSLIKFYKDEINRAVSLGAKYVVFPIYDVSIEESYTYKWLHTNEEVIDASIEIINEVLKDVEPTFKLFIENSWWPGFTYVEVREVAQIISGITYGHHSIMLNIGHYMNADRSPTQGIGACGAYLVRHQLIPTMLYAYPYFSGIRLNQSLSHRYYTNKKKKIPDDLPADYFEAYAKSCEHINTLDRRRPFTSLACVEMLEQLKPSFLTHDLASYPGMNQLQATKKQLRTIHKGYEVLREGGSVWDL